MSAVGAHNRRLLLLHLLLVVVVVIAPVLLVVVVIRTDAAAPPRWAAGRAQPAHPTPTFPGLRRTLMYAYAAFCTRDLADWRCFWCERVRDGSVPPVAVHAIIEDEGTSDVYGYVGRAEVGGARVVVVAFRGSSTLRNWWEDFDLYESAFPDVPDAAVHHGFFRAYMSVHAQVLAAVRNLTHGERDGGGGVLVTGHSLGAALSNICGVLLRRAGVQNVTVSNFGEPRVGNAAYAAYAHAVLARGGGALFRSVNEHDPVPHLPFEWLGYTHAPRELWFNASTTAFVACNATDGEDPRCCASLPPWDWRPADHLLYLGFNQADGWPHGCDSHLLLP